MTVSVCVAEDVPELIKSAAALFVEDGGSRDPFLDTGWPAREGLVYYTGRVQDPDCLCLLAGDGAGHLIGRLLPPDELRPGAVRAQLESMRVAPERRREGVGGELVDAFLTWAGDRGANEVTVSAYARNETALAFYENRGFRPFLVTLSRA
ncbi:GNAT family N-acetyltransferase [Amycolatopsis sp. OK19-0408]|uniref:GNAT family N-acetyltransferase n=1 Tax=Amycolatopsis iheyensis TaxID=2945988 RepID=A0A9X2N7N8_9PSEU|nr:GNAT family N-acetyltransferase [Amycolatopsis iheyensis]MCR6482417.1 GNAT family N-acetyltransferase [Amycolatopsis iheyensis]